MKRTTLAVLGVALSLGALSVPATAADIYRCVDDDGVVHFTNAPTKDCFVRVISVRPQPPAPDAQVGRSGVAKYEALIVEAAARHRVEPALIKAVIHAESNFDPRAVSRRGARGLMQLMPQTAKRYGLSDPFEPRGNIDAGVRHLKMLLEKYQGDLRLALAAYNAGEQAVERYGRRIPPFPETQGYVQAVLRHHAAYGGGTATVKTASR